MPLTAPRPDDPAPTEINWHTDNTNYQLNSPNHVEQAHVERFNRRYRLIAFYLRYPREIGWDIRIGRNFGIAVMQGTAPDFAAAKAAAEEAWRTIKDISPETLRKPVTAPRSVP